MTFVWDGEFLINAKFGHIYIFYMYTHTHTNTHTYIYLFIFGHKIFFIE